MVEAGSPFELREYPLPAVAERTILVKVLCCTICRSDYHTYSGKRNGPVPLILGHEIIGEIVELGKGVSCDMNDRPLMVGNRITWTITAGCGQCYYCRVAELPMKCIHLFKYGHDSCAEPPHFLGGFAEYCLIQPGTGVIKVPDELPDEVAAPANCALATVMACWDAASLKRGDSVLIQGAGGLGCYAAAVARSSGCKRVIVADVSAKRLEFARLFGATDTIEVQRTGRSGSGVSDQKETLTANSGTAVSLVEQSREFTEGRGVDRVLEVTGVPEAVPAGLRCLRKGGLYIEAGCSFPAARVDLDLSIILWNRITVTGVHNYHSRHLKAAVDFLEAEKERFPFEKIVTKRYPLEQIDRAMEAAASGEELRVAVFPSITP
jgi:alcohol dehydrogenase